jgi:hypothetical protein
MVGKIMFPSSDMILPTMILPLPVALKYLRRRGAMSVESGCTDKRGVKGKQRLASAVHTVELQSLP